MLHATFLVLQARAPQSVWDMATGGTLPTKLVLLILQLHLVY